MEKSKIKRLKQLLNEYILDNEVNLNTPIYRVYSEISEKYNKLKNGTNKN